MGMASSMKPDKPDKARTFVRLSGRCDEQDTRTDTDTPLRGCPVCPVSGHSLITARATTLR